jgi:glycosyltransferase involved in cell wall biosynthesis
VHGDVDRNEVEVPLEDADPPRYRLPALVRPIRPVTDALALAELMRIVRRYRPHLIHTHLSKAGILGRTAGLLARPSARRVHTFHGTLFANYFGTRATAAIVSAERFLGRRTDRIVALSERQRWELLEHRITSRRRIAIIPLGLDLQRFGSRDRLAARAALNIASDREVVVTAGRMVPIKRLDRLIAAFVRVRASRPTAHLYFVGDGPERHALEELAQAERVGDAVTFVGWAADVSDWYTAADVVTLTSDREGTPLSLMEAAAAGRPVVATAVGGVSDVVIDGETGYLVGADDVGGFAERVTRLLASPFLAERLGSAAAAHAERFAADRLIGDLDRLYRDLLRGSRRG